MPYALVFARMLTSGNILLCNSSSSTKFDSGTGWPSFHSAMEVNSCVAAAPQLSVVEKHDYSHGMVRVEVLCREVSFFPKIIEIEQFIFLHKELPP